MVTKCSGYVEEESASSKNKATCFGRLLIKYTTIGLRTSGYGAVEVFIDFAEELKHTETNPMCKIHQKPSYVTRTFETKILRSEMICPAEPHERSPNAPKFEDRSQEETEWQERCAREAAWWLAKCVLKLKEKNNATFLSPSENWCLPAPSTVETRGKRICCRLRSVDAHDQQKGLE